MLTRVNDQPHTWFESCPGLTLESSFKTITMTIFIFTLTQVNPYNQLNFHLNSKCSLIYNHLNFHLTLIFKEKNYLNFFKKNP